MIHLQITCPACGSLHQLLLGEGATGEGLCGQCKRHLVQFRPLAGFIYVLSNAKMPALFKLGFTTRPVEDRVGELNSETGVPAPFIIEAYFASETPEAHEAAVFQQLAPSRLGGKEFFEAELGHILKTVEAVTGSPAYYARKDIRQLEREKAATWEKALQEMAERAAWNEQERVARKEQELAKRKEQERVARENAERERAAREKARRKRIARKRAEKGPQEKPTKPARNKAARAARDRMAKEWAEQERKLTEQQGFNGL